MDTASERSTDRDRGLPARSALTGRPQVLGLLPTLRFWNDRARQRTILPWIAGTGIPLVWALEHLALKLHLGAWPGIAFAVVYPFLIMGLVERQIRRELRDMAFDRRLARATEDGAARPPGRTLLVAAAIFSALVATLVALQLHALALPVAALVAAASYVLLRPSRVALPRPGGGDRPR